MAFERDGIEDGLHELDVAVVGVDDELAIAPLGIFVSADQEFQGELIEDVIVGGFQFVAGKRAENGAWFGDVLDKEFVSEFREQRIHDGSWWYLPFQVRKRGTMRSMDVASATSFLK
ncbi:hypothetical protein [Bryobacter aggregatus]|uniref:hypothetical protein n=1 Tax=Bryobacter aggregatus TaxID=360054 RepID=UPI0012BA57A5|nr:hypothetical protein [Bryobacter aggregatus]